MVLTVELSKHTIKLHPPQRIVLLEITNEALGSCLRIFPATGVDLNNIRLVGKVRRLGRETDVPKEDPHIRLILTRLSGAFPRLSSIDVREIPKDYQITFSKTDHFFQFESGGRYFVYGISDHVWEATVVAI